MVELIEPTLQAEGPKNNNENEASPVCVCDTSSVDQPIEEQIAAIDLQRRANDEKAILKDLLQRLERHAVGDILALLDSDNEVDRQKLLNHWETKGTQLLTQCLELKDKIKKNKAIKELEDWIMIQEERIVSAREWQQEESDTAKGQKEGTTKENPAASVEEKKPFARIASEDPTLRKTMKRVATTSTDLTDQIRQEADIERTVIEERLALEEGVGPIEKTKLEKELASITAILQSTKTIKEEYRKDCVYFELSCRKCNGHHMKFVGAAVDFQYLRAARNSLFGQVVNMVRKKSNKTLTNNTQDKVPRESWSTNFALHFSQHCKPSKNLLGMKNTLSEEKIIDICQENIKVEVLKREAGSQLFCSGSELFWEIVQLGV